MFFFFSLFLFFFFSSLFVCRIYVFVFFLCPHTRLSLVLSLSFFSLLTGSFWGFLSVRSLSDPSTPSTLFLFLFLSGNIFGRRDSSFFSGLLLSWYTVPDMIHPDLSTSLNQYDSWPVIHLVYSVRVFHISLRPQKKYNRENGRKKNKRTIWTYVSSKCKKRSLCDDFFSFSCICRLRLACILRETSSKRHQQCWHLLALVNRPLCSTSGLSSRLSDFC